MWAQLIVKSTSYGRNSLERKAYKCVSISAFLAFGPAALRRPKDPPLSRGYLTMTPANTDTIRGVGVSKYGSLENLESRRLPRPSPPTGRQMLVCVKAVAVNPIDIKVRGGVYDDAPDYYERVKPLTQDEPHFHVMGYDGAGVVLGVGPDVKNFKKGDEIFYLGNPLGQGCYEEEMLVDERQYVHDPRSPTLWATLVVAPRDHSAGY